MLQTESIRGLQGKEESQGSEWALHKGWTETGDAEFTHGKNRKGHSKKENLM